ncbi:hypothetical protein B0F90DRAFT_1812912 [Multifurca ochricompacta]|uniref:non-specific serine/threonine protein kinase n=1 Tax=Multifurca ochricompacta TaxID=376703 RepID=A0AAD4QR91_9AGAM|nr:hypothetical protein B0F90DRAFT_1812912 [Multifurca ochricompacta]
MPLMIPGSRKSMALRNSLTTFPASPPLSECESVTPRSQAYPDTPPVLDADIFDPVPFSASFSSFLDFTIRDDALQRPTITADTAPDRVEDAKRLSSRADASYYVEQLSNIKDIDSEWEDDEVEEVMIISPKPKTSDPLLVSSSVAHALPTPPFSPPTEPSLGFSLPIAPQESYTILRTLHRTQTSHTSLAVASGCAPSTTKKAALRHALYAIRTYRLPLSHSALAERAALDVLSTRNHTFIVLEHCGGGNLMGLIQAEGPVDSTRMKRWACEIASGIAFIHNSSIIHSNIRPSTILFRVNGHVCISGFDRAIVIASRQTVAPSSKKDNADTCECTRVQPWYHSTREHPDIVRDCILNGLSPVAPLEAVNPAIEHLIVKCLNRDPSKRPTVEEIQASEWFADIDWDGITLPCSSNIPITIPTPDLTPDVLADMPSIIVAPDLSHSTLDTEAEIERSLPWTPARINRPVVGLVSPGATTIASGHSVLLSHADMARFIGSRPQNPSPPSLPSSNGGGDTPKLKFQQSEEQGQSFLPQLSETEGTKRIGLGVCVDEFGTFLSEHEREWGQEEESNESPQISLQDALALPIPLLVTPHMCTPPDQGLSSRSLLPARFFRWRNSSTSASTARDTGADSHVEREQELPELSWNGLDADPFRCSPLPSVPTEGQEVGRGGYEDTASSRRVDVTFRWSTVSLEMGLPQRIYGNKHAHVHALSFATLTGLTRRLCEQGRTLLRKSRSNVLLPRPRLPSPAVPSASPESFPSPPQPLTLSLRTAIGYEENFSGMQRIGLGIGYSLPSPSPRQGLTAQLAGTICTQTHSQVARVDSEEAGVAGCYAGLGGRRGKKNMMERQQNQLDGLNQPASDQQGSGSGPKLSPWDLGDVLVCAGNPGAGGTTTERA